MGMPVYTPAASPCRHGVAHVQLFVHLWSSHDSTWYLRRLWRSAVIGGVDTSICHSPVLPYATWICLSHTRHVPALQCSGPSTPIHMPAVSRCATWWHRHACLHTRSVPAPSYGSSGRPICTRDNTWRHRHAFSHWVSVPVPPPHGDGRLPAHVPAVAYAITRQHRLTSSYQCHAMSGAATKQHGPLCSHGCRSPGLIHGSSGAPSYTCDVPRHDRMVEPAYLHTCLLCSRATAQQPGHACLHSCHIPLLPRGGLGKHICTLVLSHLHSVAGCAHFFFFFFCAHAVSQCQHMVAKVLSFPSTATIAA